MTKQMQDSSSDSDFYDDKYGGATTRRAWSDWCSNKGKSSQSEEDVGITSHSNHKVTSMNLQILQYNIDNIGHLSYIIINNYYLNKYLQSHC